MRKHLRTYAVFTALALAAGGVLLTQSRVSAQTPIFKSGVNLILVDVVVRDKNGNLVTNLTDKDFQVIEDGKTQTIAKFSFEQISAKAAAIETATTLTATSKDDKSSVPITIGIAPKPSAKPAAPAADAKPPAPAVDADKERLTSDIVAGHRLWVMLFDTSSMQPEDVQKAADAAIKWTNEKMTTSDLVLVSAITSTLAVLQDFTTDKAKILQSLNGFAAAEGLASSAVDVDTSTMSADESQASQTADSTTTVDPSSQELDTFTVDMRLRAITTICDALRPLQQKKGLLYFSGGMQRSGTDNQVELREATNSCSKSNVNIDPIDSRGLQAIVAGGSANQGSRGGTSMFNGSSARGQFTQLAAQQETLQTMASDTGGTAFTDSNDFGEAFDKVQQDLSSYYILGYSSTNPSQDGKYRRIDVKLTNSKLDYKVKAREGYVADRDFAHTAKGDRAAIMQDQLYAALPALDLPTMMSADYFRLTADKCPNSYGRGGGRGGGRPGGFGPGAPGGGGAGGSATGSTQAARGPVGSNCYYVPVALVIPGAAIPVSTAEKVVSLDLLGYIQDERKNELGSIKATITVPPGNVADIKDNKPLIYQTGVELPPGRYVAKIVVRENTTGQMGTYELPVIVPSLNTQDVRVSSVVLSSQLQSVPPTSKSLSPLDHDGVEIVPNITGVVSRDDNLYVYYEVYDPQVDPATHDSQLRTYLTFFRTVGSAKIKVFETPVVERTGVDAPDRKAAIFQFAIAASQFKPGRYSCQVTVIDEVAGKFTFPHVDMFVREGKTK